MPTDMILAAVIALKAYSTWNRRPWSEKMVMCLSKAALFDMLAVSQLDQVVEVLRRGGVKCCLRI